MKKKENKNLKNKIINIPISLLFAISTIFLILNLIKLYNIENLIRYTVIGILVLLLIFLIRALKKKNIIYKIIIILLCIIYNFLNYNFYRIYSSLDNISTIVDTKVICLVTSLEEVTNIDNITESDIAILNADMDSELNEFALDLINEEGLDNILVEYDDYHQIINALLNKEVDYAFLPKNYNDIYNNSNSTEEKTELPFNIIYEEEKIIEREDSAELKNINEPFTMLLMGTDIILDSYNADTLLVMTVNPKTMSVTMLSIPRDTYAVIACTGGKHKINASGWYGDSCVVKTVEKYLDIKIDYYAKMNFQGVVSLVDKMGGIEVDVPYSFCEQNSQRQFGNNMIYVDEGFQKLNGEQALALSRNRHYWKDLCPSKYTTDGERSDITRGENQQLVIKGILNKVMTIRDLNAFYDILDTVGDNMTTNMSRETILSFYNLGKEIVKKLNSSSVDEIININKLHFKSYSATIFLSGLNLSTIVNYEESIDYVSEEMKKNLEILKKEDIKTFSFDINVVNDEDTIKYKKLTTSLRLFPNFIGKSINEALSYCNQNNLKCEKSGASNSKIIISQSITANTDISTIRSKTIIFETENIISNNNSINNKEAVYSRNVLDELEITAIRPTMWEEHCLECSFIEIDFRV